MYKMELWLRIYIYIIIPTNIQSISIAIYATNQLLWTCIVLNSNRLRSSENIVSASDLAEDLLIKCDCGEIRLFTIQSTVSIDQGSPDGRGGFLLVYQSNSGSKYGIVVLFSYAQTIWMKIKNNTWSEWAKIQLS